MKKILKILLPILTIIATAVFLYNFFVIYYSQWNLTFFIALILSVCTQFLFLKDFKVFKKILFILLLILLNIIVSIAAFFITGNFSPYSAEYDIEIVTTLIGIMILFFNILVLPLPITSLINKLKEKEKPKKSYFSLLFCSYLIILIVYTLILFLINK